MPPKHDSSNATEKALVLFSLLLFSKKEHSLTELAQSLQCSKQTILRLVDQIETTNFLKVDKVIREGRNYYKALLPAQKANVSFNPDELQQLLFCRDFFSHLLPKSHKKLLNSATDKAQALSNTQENFPRLGQTSVKGSVDYTNFEHIIEALTNAIRTHEVVEIEYRAKERKETKLHTLVPLGVVAYHDVLYIRAWKVKDKGKVSIINPITFALHRIQRLWTTNIAMSKAEFEAMPFPEQKEESHVFGMAMQTAPFSVEIRFYPPATSYIRERQWSSDQQIIENNDESLILRMTAQSELEVVKWVLGFGMEAQLLSPLYLRKRVIRELDRAIMMYE